MSFLDPYSKNRRIPLIWIGRAALLVIAVVVYFVSTWFWDWLNA